MWVFILGDKDVRFDLMTGPQKRSIEAFELECSRLKNKGTFKLLLMNLSIGVNGEILPVNNRMT